MTTGDPATDAFVVLLYLAAFLGVLVVPAAILEALLGPEERR